MSEQSRIARNAASSYAARGVLVLSVFVLTPYLFRRLGPAGFGTWSVMLTITAVFSLLETGFSAGIVRFVAAFRAQGRREDVERVVATGAVLLTGLGIVAFVISVAAAFLLSGLAAPGDGDAFRAGMLVLGGAMLLRFPFVAYAGALNGYQRFDLSNASLALATLASAVGAVVAVEAGFGLFGGAGAHAAALVAGAALYRIQFARIEPTLSLRPRLGDRDARRRIYSFSSFALLADSMLYIGQRMDVVLIAALRDAAAAAPYAAAVKLQSGVQGLTLPFVDLLMPMASELGAQGRRTELLRRLALATRVATQVTLPLAFGLALFAPDIVDVWLGEGAPAVTATIIVLLMATQVLALSAAPARKVLIGLGRVRLIGALSVVEGLANVGLTVALVVLYGPVGAAIATFVTVAVIAPLKLPIAARMLGVPARKLARDGWGAAVASSLPGIVVMTALFLALAPGTVRATAGPALGLLVSAAVAFVQIGPVRIGAALRSQRRMLARDPVSTAAQLGSELPVEGSP